MELKYACSNLNAPGARECPRAATAEAFTRARCEDGDAPAGFDETHAGLQIQTRLL